MKCFKLSRPQDSNVQTVDYYMTAYKCVLTFTAEKNEVLKIYEKRYK